MLSKMCESPNPSNTVYDASLNRRAVARNLARYASDGKGRFGRILLALTGALLLASAWQLQAAPITYTINGTLGDSAVSGPDILLLAGKTFQISGTIDSAAVPITTGAGTATFSFPSLTISIGQLTVSLPGVPVTFTINNGNVATVSVGTNFTGIPISAVIGLPPGTMTTPAPTAFSQVAIAAGTDPVLGSILTYGQNANTTVLAITGDITASASGPTMIASPPALSFGFLLGGPPAPPPQTFQIDAGSNISLSAATDGAGWISVSPSSGITPAVFTVSVDPHGIVGRRIYQSNLHYFGRRGK